MSSVSTLINHLGFHKSGEFLGHLSIKFSVKLHPRAFTFLDSAPRFVRPTTFHTAVRVHPHLAMASVTSSHTSTAESRGRPRQSLTTAVLSWDRWRIICHFIGVSQSRIRLSGQFDTEFRN